jgi:hypothetical protein
MAGGRGQAQTRIKICGCLYLFWIAAYFPLKKRLIFVFKLASIRPRGAQFRPIFSAARS